VDRVHVEQGLHADRALRRARMKTLHKRCGGSRRAQDGGGGLPSAGHPGEGKPRGALISNDHPGPAGACGLAGASRLYACGDGGNGRLLEAGQARPGRPVPTDPGQRRAYQRRTRAQERHERCDLDRRSIGAWPDAGELRAATADPRTARPDADEKATHPRDRTAHQRVQAVLEEANVKLSSLITDILGASGRRILKASR
jgi:hypothetical protein